MQKKVLTLCVNAYVCMLGGVMGGGGGVKRRPPLYAFLGSPGPLFLRCA